MEAALVTGMEAGLPIQLQSLDSFPVYITTKIKLLQSLEAGGGERTTGGHGGGLNGQDGYGYYSNVYSNGKGGTQTHGGAGGSTHYGVGGSGGFGYGGSGIAPGKDYGPGGGGGWYGGGGTFYAGGGGGGSSYIGHPLLYDASTEPGINNDNGRIIIEIIEIIEIRKNTNFYKNAIGDKYFDYEKLFG